MSTTLFGGRLYISIGSLRLNKLAFNRMACGCYNVRIGPLYASVVLNGRCRERFFRYDQLG